MVIFQFAMLVYQRVSKSNAGNLPKATFQHGTGATFCGPEAATLHSLVVFI